MHVVVTCLCRLFTDNVPAQLWYFTKCVYFVLSCYQIRYGYPTRIIGNVLTKNYNYFNLVLFKGYHSLYVFLHVSVSLCTSLSVPNAVFVSFWPEFAWQRIESSIPFVCSPTFCCSAKL